MKSSELIKLLERAGWLEVAVRGSHHHFKHPVQPWAGDGAPSQEGLACGDCGCHPQASRPEEVKGLAMRYPVAIEPGDDRHAWGVTVPDLPGCFSAGDSMEDALDSTKEAILLHIEGLIDDGQPVPEAQPIEKHRRKREFKNRVWALVEVDLSQLEDVTERVNITLPRRVLHKLDAAARAAGETRSGFIAHLALTSH